jgi:type IV pilus assembly protein PilY1
MQKFIFIIFIQFIPLFITINHTQAQEIDNQQNIITSIVQNIGECPNVNDYTYFPPSIKTNDYVNIMMLLDYSPSMLDKAYIKKNNLTNNLEQNLSDVAATLEHTNYEGYFEWGGLFGQNIIRPFYCYDADYNGINLSYFLNISALILNNLKISGNSSTISDFISNIASKTSLDRPVKDPKDPIIYNRCNEYFKDMVKESVQALNNNLIEIVKGLIQTGIGAITSIGGTTGNNNACTVDVSDITEILMPYLNILIGFALGKTGNELNREEMTRIDYIKWFTTGGKPEKISKCEGNTCLGIVLQEGCCTGNCIAVDVLQLVNQLITIISGGGVTLATGAIGTATGGIITSAAGAVGGAAAAGATATAVSTGAVVATTPAAPVTAPVAAGATVASTATGAAAGAAAGGTASGVVGAAAGTAGGTILGGTTGAGSGILSALTGGAGITTVLQGAQQLLNPLGLGLYICIPKPQEMITEDSCKKNEDKKSCENDKENNCNWKERDVIKMQDNSVALKWNTASSYVRDNGTPNIIRSVLDLNEDGCQFNIYDSSGNLNIISKRRSSTYKDSEGNEGCLEGALQDIAEVDKEQQINLPRIGGIIIDKDFKATSTNKIFDPTYPQSDTGFSFRTGEKTYSDFLAAINNTVVDNGTDNTPLDEAYKAAKTYFEANNAYTFDILNKRLNKNLELPCTKNAIFTFSDGSWNGNNPLENIHNLWLGSTKDLKDNIPGSQNVETYTFDIDLSDNISNPNEGTNSLMNAAIFGGYRDYDKNGFPNPYTNIPEATSQIKKSNIEWDANLDTIPDNYVTGSLKWEFSQTINSIFNMAVQGALEQTYNSSSPAVVRFNNSNIGLWINAYYFPKMIYEAAKATTDTNKNDVANWRGDVQAYFLDANNSIRENTLKTTNEDDDKGIYFTYEDEVINFITDTDKHIKDVENKRDREPDEEDYITNFLTLYAIDYGKTGKDNITIPEDCSIDSVKEILKEHNNNDKLNPVWSALFNFTEQDNPHRLIYFNNNENNKNIELKDNFNAENLSTLSHTTWCSVVDDKSLSTIVNTIRNGFQGDNTKKYYKIGDIINSSPLVVPPHAINDYHHKYHDLTYYDYTNSEMVRKRLPVVIAGGNDGMVHAFYIGYPTDNVNNNNKAGLEIKSNDLEANPQEYKPGQEIWAFIPYNVLPYIQWYMIEGEKFHIPKVDYNFTLVDASIGRDDKAAPDGDLKKESWRTLLVGTMGFGGKKMVVNGETFSSSLFVLDITNTDPNNTKYTDNGDKPKLLWEAKLPDNTLLITQPTIIKINTNSNNNERKNGKWYVIVGSGPLNPKSDQFVRNPKIYAFDLKTGDRKDLELPNTIQTSISNKSLGEIMEIDSDNNYSDDALFFGTYDNSSNTKFGRGMNSSIKDTGSFYGMSIDDNDINNLKIKNIIKLLDDNLTAPYFAKPTNTFDENGNIWVYTASGRLFNKNDTLTDREDSNYIIGIKFSLKESTANRNMEINNTIDKLFEDSKYKNLTRKDLLDSTNIKIEGECITQAACYCGNIKVEEISLNNNGCIDNIDDIPNCTSSCCEGNECTKVVEEYEKVKFKNGAKPRGVQLENNGDNDVIKLANYMKSDEAREKGWLVELDRGEARGYENVLNIMSYERIYSKPVVSGGLLNAVSYQPALNICSVRGTTSIYGLHYLTGTASDRPTYMIGSVNNGTNLFSATTKDIQSKSTLGLERTSTPPPMGLAITNVKNDDGTFTTFVGSNSIKQQTPNSTMGITSRILLKKIR